MSNPLYPILLTDSGTITVVTGAYAIVIDKKTGRIKKVVPEMPLWDKHAATLASAAELLANTEELHGVEELRVQAVKLILSTTDKLAKETLTAKAA